ncbi:MAG: energy-coupling factor transporter transmembrane component T [Chromatiaceae bacterium]
MPRLPGTKPPGQTMSPGIDSRAKILAALMLIAAIVLTAPMDLAEFLVVVLFVGAVVALLDGSVIAVLRRGLLVLPFAGAIALFAPLARIEAGSWAGVAAAYARGWPLILALLAKAYLSVLIVSALTATTPVPELLRGMQALRVPDIFLTLFIFLLRYRDLFRAQVAALRDAIASRAPRLRGWRRLFLYGSLGGNLLVRAYERGEQVYDAMIARGYSGTLPVATPLCWRGADSGFIAIGLVFAGALVIYR